MCPPMYLVAVMWQNQLKITGNIREMAILYHITAEEYLRHESCVADSSGRLIRSQVMLTKDTTASDGLKKRRIMSKHILRRTNIRV